MRAYITRHVFLNEKTGYLLDPPYVYKQFSHPNPVASDTWKNIKERIVLKDTIFKLFNGAGDLLDNVCIVPKPITPVINNQV